MSASSEALGPFDDLEHGPSVVVRAFPGPDFRERRIGEGHAAGVMGAARRRGSGQRLVVDEPHIAEADRHRQQRLPLDPIQFPESGGVGAAHVLGVRQQLAIQH